MGDLVDAMVQETHLRLSSNPRWKDQSFTTLYLGGGTPSILPPDLLKALVSGVLTAVGQDASDFREVTLEANPEDMTKAQIQTWLGLGVTRLSLGVQSFHDETLAWMNRAHTGVQAERAIRLAHDLGVKAMTLDLIYGVPTSRDWNDDIARATALPIQHLSAYALTVEPGTVLGTRVERGAEQPAPDARTAEEYHRLCDAMAAQGWSHYETSNWAAPKPTKGTTNRNTTARIGQARPTSPWVPAPMVSWAPRGTPTCPTTPGTSKPFGKAPCWTSGKRSRPGTGTTSL